MATASKKTTAAKKPAAKEAAPKKAVAKKKEPEFPPEVDDAVRAQVLTQEKG